MSAIVVICGALEVGEIWTMWFGIVTDCAIGIVALEAISPMITLAWFDFDELRGRLDGCGRLRLPVLASRQA